METYASVLTKAVIFFIILIIIEWVASIIMKKPVIAREYPIFRHNVARIEMLKRVTNDIGRIALGFRLRLRSV